MRHRLIGLIIALLTAILAAPSLCGAATIAGAWSSASRLSAAEASRILLRQAEGEPVSALELFEAEKYLRSDGGVSAGSLVLSDMLTRLLARRAQQAGADLRIRTLPPVLHWLETTNEQDRLRLRGESLQVAVLNSEPDVAVTVLFHRTTFQDWRLCAGAPCFTSVRTPLRSRVAYLLTTRDSAAPSDARASQLLLATELTGWLQGAESVRARYGLAQACDPLPAETASHGAGRQPMSWFRHTVDETIDGNVNQVLCSFRVGSSPASARLTYLVSSAVAVAPSSAARSAVVNNPLSFDLFEESAHRWSKGETSSRDED
jgi:hypothetical protein